VRQLCHRQLSARSTKEKWQRKQKITAGALDPFARLSGSLILDPGRREWWERRGLWRFTVAGGFSATPSSLIQSIPGLERCWAAKYNVGEDVEVGYLPPTRKDQNKSVFPPCSIVIWRGKRNPIWEGSERREVASPHPPSLQTLTKAHTGE
jgi:hypothetical protein